MLNSATHTPFSVVTPRPTYTQIKTYFDDKYELAWCYMNANPRPCYTPELLTDLNRWCEGLQNGRAASNSKMFRYHVLASDVPGVYNLGGDLNLFRNLIQARNRHALLQYARSCIDVLYSNIVHFYRDITTISLVQGDAFGGGFEAALSSDVLIAERSAKLGLPEILFNLFPGMGAYSLLSRRIGGAPAERLILSGNIHTAEELYEMGIVDILAEDGQGEAAVYDYIRKENKSANGYRALRAAKNCVNPVTYEELKNIVEIWVDAALRLEKRDLRMLEILVSRQTKQKFGPKAQPDL